MRYVFLNFGYLCDTTGHYTSPNKVQSHHAAPTPMTLAVSSMADRLQAGHSGLQMSSWPGTVIPRWRTSSSSRVGVSKASAFHFVSWTLFPVPNSQLTATELFHSPLYESGTVFRTISHLLHHFPSSALAWRHISSNSATRNYCCRARKVTLSFMDTLIALTYLFICWCDIPTSGSRCHEIYCMHWSIVLCVDARSRCDDLVAASWCIASMPWILTRRRRSAFLWCCLVTSHIAALQFLPVTWHTVCQLRCCTQRGACVVLNMPCRRSIHLVMQVSLHM